MKPLRWTAVMLSAALIGCQSPAVVPPPATSSLPATAVPSATVTIAPTALPTATPTATPGAPPVPAGLGNESPIAPGEALDLPAMHIQLTRVLRGAEAAARVPADKRERWLMHAGWEWAYVEFTQSGTCRNPQPTPTADVTNDVAVQPGVDYYCPYTDVIFAGDRSGMAYVSRGKLDAKGDIFLYDGVDILSLQDTIGYIVSVPPDAELAYVVFPYIYRDELPTRPGRAPELRYFDAVFLLEPDVTLAMPAVEEANAAGRSPDQPAGLGETVVTASWTLTLTKLLRGQEAAAFAQEHHYESPHRNMPNLVATFELVSQGAPGPWRSEEVPDFFYTQSDSVDHEIVNPYNRFGMDHHWSLRAFPGASLTYVLVTHVDETRGPVVLHARWYQNELEPNAVTNILTRDFVGSP